MYKKVVVSQTLTFAPNSSPSTVEESVLWPLDGALCLYNAVQRGVFNSPARKWFSGSPLWSTFLHLFIPLFLFVYFHVVRKNIGWTAHAWPFEKYKPTGREYSFSNAFLQGTGGLLVMGFAPCMGLSPNTVTSERSALTSGRHVVILHTT